MRPIRGTEHNAPVVRRLAPKVVKVIVGGAAADDATGREGASGALRFALLSIAPSGGAAVAPPASSAPSGAEAQAAGLGRPQPAGPLGAA